MRTIIISSLFLAIFTAHVFGAVNDATRKIVQDALFEALTKLSSISEPSVSDGSIISSQTANDESKMKQFNGEFLELASQILVGKYGVSILEDANEVLQELTGGNMDSLRKEQKVQKKMQVVQNKKKNSK